MNTKPIASFNIQTNFIETLAQEVKVFRAKIVANLTLFSLLIATVLLNQSPTMSFTFITIFVMFLFVFGIFVWIIWTVIVKFLLEERRNHDLYQPFNLNFYADKIVFHEYYQQKKGLRKMDKWKIENFAKDLLKEERTIEYFHEHIQSFELTYTDNLFIVMIHIGNTIQRFNLEIENQNYVIAMQKVLSQLYNQNIKITETNQHNQRTHLLKVINDEQEKEIDPSIQKLINQLGKHKQDE